MMNNDSRIVSVMINQIPLDIVGVGVNVVPVKNGVDILAIQENSVGLHFELRGKGFRLCALILPQPSAVSTPFENKMDIILILGQIVAMIDDIGKKRRIIAICG